MMEPAVSNDQLESTSVDGSNEKPNEMTIARQATGSIIHYSNSPIVYPANASPRVSSDRSTLLSAIRTSSLPIYPQAAFISSPQSVHSSSPSGVEMLDLRVHVICNWLYQQQLQRMWSVGDFGEGVMVKQARDQYVCCPMELSSWPRGFHDAIQQLNVKCAMTVNTRTTKLMLEIHETAYIPLNSGLRLQVFPSMAQLSRCQRNKFAAFVQQPPILVVWDDDPAHIVDRVQELESQMVNLIWETRIEDAKEKDHSNGAVIATNSKINEHEATAAGVATRRTILTQSLIAAITLVLTFLALGIGWRNIAIEIKIQRSWTCLIFPAMGPIQAWLGLFFFQTMPTCVAQMVGPVRQMRQNSRFYSGHPTRRVHGSALPHITVQCPLYKESLHAVIEPTIKSIKTAISTYEMQGGTANIFVNDDGLQLLAEDQAQERRDFYDEHNIGWVARPRHNTIHASGEKPFLRAGKFKKASNMNYGLNISVRVEDKMQTVNRASSWTTEQERAAYDEALTKVIAEDGGRTWAAGNVRVGDYILLVDSDTRVPRDCLLDAVSEMEQSPEVAIIQFSSDVMNVTESWFEKGITFFTRLVYTTIEFAVSNGDVAPFVGHNALLRWTAIQDVAEPSSVQPVYHKFWSENTVSEDFDMSLRLQTSGYTLRLAAYAHGGFKEGVSLTVYDELARWEKYAYGCSELVFNPLVQWLFRGPFTPTFRRFVLSSMPLPSKISIVAYVGTYFAIGSSWLLSLLNYFAVGWYNGYLDHYYMNSFKTYFSTVIVFSLLGNVALAMLRYRIDEKKLVPALFENFKWAFFLAIFLGGISLHISQAILCHLFSIDMTWGATSKEAEDTSFFHEIPIILRKFRFTFIFCLMLTITMLTLSGIGPLQNIVPHDWQITQFIAILPLAVLTGSHALLPLVLNPGLMQFTF